MTARGTSAVVGLSAADLEAVEVLRERNTGTLGFLPKSVISKHLDRGDCLGVKDDDGCLIAYLLFARLKRDRQIHIIHLCVVDEERGEGHARRLINRLKDMANEEDIAAIKLNCRRDYSANRMWPKLGFVPLDDKPAKTPGKRLTFWLLGIKAHEEPDLFRIAASVDRINAVIDAQVFFHLHESNSEQALVSRGLQADFLAGLLQLFITDETFVEINRNQSVHQRERSRQNAHSFPKIPYSAQKADEFESRLRKILPTNTDSQISDIRQLSKTAASSVRNFVTLDAGIYRVAVDIHATLGISVLHPNELIGQLDELTDHQSYASNPLLGSGLISRKLSYKDLKGLSIVSFLGPHERKHHFLEPLNESLSLPKEWVTEALCLKDDLVAIRALQYKPAANRITVKLCRASRGPEHKLFTQFSIASILQEAIRRNCEEVLFLPGSTTPGLEDELRHFGFLKVRDGFVRLCLPKVVSAVQLQEHLHNIGYDGSVPGDPEMACSPAALSSGGADGFLVPIRPGYAKVLFDTDLARDDLFGADRSVLLRWRNVYFRRKSHHRILKPPARIIWYASSPVSAAVAISHLDSVEMGSPKDMFREHHRLGALTWPEIYEMCKGETVQDIMVLRFSHTYLFSEVVQLADLHSLYGKYGKTPVVQSPSRMPKELFLDIFRMGFMKRKPS